MESVLLDDAWFWAWTISIVVGIGTTVYCQRREPDPEARQAVWISFASMAVGTVFLLEFALRFGLARWTGGPVRPLHFFGMLFPALAGIPVGLALLVWSFDRRPPWRGPPATLAARITQAVAWGLSSWQAIVSLVSV